MSQQIISNIPRVEKTTLLHGLENVPPTKPVLIQPTKFSLIYTRQEVLFKWHKSLDTDPIKYKLHIDGPWAINMNYDNILDTVYQLPANTINSAGYYRWNITANDGVSTIVSLPDSFFVKMTPTNFGIISHHTGDYIDVTKDVKFIWEESYGMNTIKYSLEFTDSGNNKTILS